MMTHFTPRLPLLLAGLACLAGPAICQAQDADGDGFTDTQEGWLGTDAQDGKSYLRAELVIDNGFFLHFTPNSPSAAYYYFWAHDPKGPWTQLKGLPAILQNGTAIVSLPNLTEAPFNVSAAQPIYFRVEANKTLTPPDYTPPPPPTDGPPSEPPGDIPTGPN